MRKFTVIAALVIATCGAGALAASVSGSDSGADIISQWKLGRMYADGDGVKRDDFRAFEYFRGIADVHAPVSGPSPQNPDRGLYTPARISDSWSIRTIISV